MKKRLRWTAPFRAWFTLSQGEKLVLAGLLAILLLGTVARYLHLRSQEPETYTPAGLESSRTPDRF